MKEKVQTGGWLLRFCWLEKEKKMGERRGEMWGSEMVGVLGSLVLGEQNPRTPGEQKFKTSGGGAAGQLF